MSDNILLDLVADIVTAHVSNNTIPAGDIPGLIQSVYASLASLGQVAHQAEQQRKPAVSVRSSVKPHAVTCLECGVKMKMLKRHIKNEHGLTPDEYRARWDLSFDYPLVAADYAAKRSELAMKIGLGRRRTADAMIPNADGSKSQANASNKVKSTAVSNARKKLGLAFDSSEKAPASN